MLYAVVFSSIAIGRGAVKPWRVFCHEVAMAFSGTLGLVIGMITHSKINRGSTMCCIFTTLKMVLSFRR